MVFVAAGDAEKIRELARVFLRGVAEVAEVLGGVLYGDVVEWRVVLMCNYQSSRFSTRAKCPKPCGRKVGPRAYSINDGVPLLPTAFDLSDHYFCLGTPTAQLVS